MKLLAPRVLIGKCSRKKVAVLLDFVQLRGGGGPCPNFLSTFHKLYILGQFGDGRTPAQIFWHTGVRKSGTSCPNYGRGGGVKVIWTKSKRTASFFGSPSLTLTMLFTSLQGMRLQFEGSQLKCGEGCELAESLDKISCHVDGWSPALDMVSFAASHVCVYTLAFSEPLPNPMINRP